VCEKTLEAIIIDPGFGSYEAERFLNEISEKNLRIKYIINTHGHVDHISGNCILKQATGAKIMIHEADAPMLTDHLKNLSGVLGFTAVSPSADLLLKDGDLIKGELFELKVIHTPGHSRGSICLYCSSESIVFTGDTLFAGSIGSTDFSDSSFENIMRSLKDKLMRLPDQTVVYPGHGPRTAIGKEKLVNPFLLG